MKPYTVLEPFEFSPLVVDSPHSGRIYPADFHFCCPLPLLRQAEDFLVDELVAEGASNAGATVVLAEFPRSYIDVNRAENDIDEAVLRSPWPSVLEPSRHTMQGLGLVRRLCRSGVPVYAEPLPIEEVQKRITDYYRPYYAELKKAIQLRLNQFNVAYLINAHSMPSGDLRYGGRADFVLGDREGTSCDPQFTGLAAELLRSMGYTVVINDPYMGMEIVKHFGCPKNKCHALQLEINRHLYMDEVRLEKNKGFSPLQQNLSRFFEFLRARVMDVGERLAAE